jgi:phenylalanyl-tRNA synthetase beta chain
MPLSVPCYQALDRFPSTERDLSFVVDKRTEFATIENGIKALNIPDLRDIQLVDFYQGPELSHGKVGLTVRLTFASPERTLTQEEVSRCGEEVLAALQSGVGAELRS